MGIMNTMRVAEQHQMPVLNNNLIPSIHVEMFPCKDNVKFATRWSAGKPWLAATRLPVVELPCCHICCPAVCHKTCAESHVPMAHCAMCHVLSCWVPSAMCCPAGCHETCAECVPFSCRAVLPCGSFLPSSALSYNPGKLWKQRSIYQFQSIS